jgi:hypothetical protein
MKTNEAGKLGGTEQVVGIGGRKYRVRTHVVVEEVDGDSSEANSEPVACDDGSFQMLLSDEDATSIDKSEQAILATAWPAMRSGLTEHLAAVSKKKPKAR